MGKYTLRTQKEKELEEYINSQHVSRVHFSLKKHDIGIIFSNGIKVKLHFDREFKFRDLYILNGDFDKKLKSEIRFTDSAPDREILKFVYNIINNREADSFIFFCERLVMELHKNYE